MGRRLVKFLVVLFCGVIFVPLFAVVIGAITGALARGSWMPAYAHLPFVRYGVIAGYSLGGLLGILLTNLLFRTIMETDRSAKKEKSRPKVVLKSGTTPTVPQGSRPEKPAEK